MKLAPFVAIVLGIILIISVLSPTILFPKPASAYHSQIMLWTCSIIPVAGQPEEEWECGMSTCDQHQDNTKPQTECGPKPPACEQEPVDSCSAVTIGHWGPPRENSLPPQQEDCEPSTLPSSFSHSYPQQHSNSLQSSNSADAENSDFANNNDDKIMSVGFVQVPSVVCGQTPTPPPPKCHPPAGGAGGTPATTITPMTISDKGIKFLEYKEGKSSSLPRMCSATVTKSCRMDSNPYGFYNDLAGYCTTGIGHLVDKVNPNGKQLDCASIDKLPPTDPIRLHKESVAGVKTKADAYKLKKVDLPNYEKMVNDNAKVQLTQEQFDALVSLAFNAGEGAVKDLFTLINAGNCDPAEITKAFVKWNKITDKAGKKVPDKGLTDRRIQEADIFNFAKYP